MDADNPAPAGASDPKATGGRWDTLEMRWPQKAPTNPRAKYVRLPIANYAEALAERERLMTLVNAAQLMLEAYGLGDVHRRT